MADIRTINYTDVETVMDSLNTTDETLIPSDMIKQYLDFADAECDRIFNTTCKPKLQILQLDQRNKPYIVINNPPLLNIQAMKVNGQSMDVNQIRFDESGVVTRIDAQNYAPIFPAAYNPYNVTIKCEVGWLEDSPITDQTDADVSAGTNVELSISNADNFAVGDYVKISSMSTAFEIVRVKAVDYDNEKLTVDIFQDHEEGSLITKQQTPEIVRDMATVLAGISAICGLIGKSYKFATSYQLPDFTIDKSPANEVFIKQMEALIQKRDYLMKNVARTTVMV